MVSSDSSNEMQLSQYVIPTDSVELPHIIDTDVRATSSTGPFLQTFEKLGRVCIGIDSQIGAKLFHPLCIYVGWIVSLRSWRRTVCCVDGTLLIRIIKNCSTHTV